MEDGDREKLRLEEKQRVRYWPQAGVCACVCMCACLIQCVRVCARMTAMPSVCHSTVRSQHAWCTRCHSAVQSQHAWCRRRHSARPNGIQRCSHSTVRTLCFAASLPKKSPKSPTPTPKSLNPKFPPEIPKARIQNGRLTYSVCTVRCVGARPARPAVGSRRSRVPTKALAVETALRSLMCALIRSDWYWRRRRAKRRKRTRQCRRRGGLRRPTARASCLCGHTPAGTGRLEKPGTGRTAPKSLHECGYTHGAQGAVQCAGGDL